MKTAIKIGVLSEIFRQDEITGLYRSVFAGDLPGVGETITVIDAENYQEKTMVVSRVDPIARTYDVRKNA